MALLIALATVLRLYHLGDGLWFDEIATYVDYIHQSTGIALGTFTTQNQHFLFTLLARASVAVFGDSIAAVRLPAVAFGIGSLVALYWLGSQLLTRAEAIGATALASVSYFHIWFSQNARGYTGLLFFTLVSTGLLLRALVTGRTRHSVLYAISIALGMASHMTMLFVVPAHLVVYARHRMRPPGPLRNEYQRIGLTFGLAALLTLVAYAPVLPQALLALVRDTGIGDRWKEPGWALSEVWRGLERSFQHGAVAAAAVTISAVGLWRLARERNPLVELSIVPVATAIAAIVATQHAIWPRLLFFAFGFGALVLVAGVFTAASWFAGQSRARTVATTAVALLAAVSAMAVPRAYGPKQDFAGALRFLERNRGVEGIVQLGALPPLQSYLGTNWPEVTSAAGLEAMLISRPRVWLIYTFPERIRTEFPGLLELAGTRLDIVQRFDGTLRGGTVYVCRPKSQG